MKIGLVGEAPNDTQAIKNLMKKRYRTGYDFFFLLNNINGSDLDSQKIKRLLRKEYEIRKPDIIIFIRDLDSVIPNKQKVNERKRYFTNSNSVIDKTGVFLLHIYEIEAIILSDIEVFNRIYNCSLNFVDNPMEVEEPKEYLRNRVKEYNESHNPDIFNEIRFDKALKCKYFKSFISKFDDKIKLV